MEDQNKHDIVNESITCAKSEVKSTSGETNVKVSTTCKSFLERIQLPRKEQQDRFRSTYNKDKSKYEEIDKKGQMTPDEAREPIQTPITENKTECKNLPFIHIRPYSENRTAESGRHFSTPSFSNLRNYQCYEEFDALFNYRRTYVKQPDWVLPDVSIAYSSPIYEFMSFRIMRNNNIFELQKVLEGFTSEEWEEVVERFWLAPRIVRVLKRVLQPNIIMKNWIKAYEIFCTYPVVSSGKLNSVHIGDNHGGFILALNHYLYSSFEEVQWNWKAICENPYYEDDCSFDMIDDRFIYNTYKNYHFGEDFSGEIRDKNNIKSFFEKSQQFEEINLAIVNSSARDQPHYSRERSVFTYQFAGLVAALKCLSKGGNLIFMSSRMFNADNISLMYFLNIIFENVHLYRPMIAPMTCVEIFIIALNFKKDELTDQYIDQMIQKVDKITSENLEYEDEIVENFILPRILKLQSTNPENSKLEVEAELDDKECEHGFTGPLFPQNMIPKSFLIQHRENMMYFDEVFKINVKKFKFYNDKPEDDHTKCWERIIGFAPFKFMDKFNIENIPRENMIVTRNIVPSRKNLEGISKLTVDFFFKESINLCIDDFEDKERFEKISALFEKFEKIKNLISWPYETECRNWDCQDDVPVCLSLEFGRPVEDVQKTMFITPSILYAFVSEIEEIYDICIAEKFPKEEISCVFDEETLITYEFVDSYGKSEREFLKKVIKKWIDLEPKKVVFKNVLFLTHFSVSILRVMASFYDVMAVSIKGTIELQDLKVNFSSSKLFSDFRETFNSDSYERVIWFAEMKYVNKGKYFEVITSFNTQLVKHYILKAFNFLISKNL